MKQSFDPALGTMLKEEGKARAAKAKNPLLVMAQKLAVEIALSRPSRHISADDVQEALSKQGVSVHALGNAAGSIFRGSQWKWTGQWVYSGRAHAHRNPLRVWEYVGTQ
ncbi:MAG: hypothetical protein GTO63_25930 [Anaerolineae bacterium]|nr:hypothetical protein [Anaerolineae bacterium]NIN98182.1 hypothetical protein [Anaerolineae bacterium]NIQ81105.1 hypothetical protein [Anaerolineae bacterium]